MDPINTAVRQSFTDIDAFWLAHPGRVLRHFAFHEHFTTASSYFYGLAGAIAEQYERIRTWSAEATAHAHAIPPMLSEPRDHITWVTETWSLLSTLPWSSLLLWLLGLAFGAWAFSSREVFYRRHRQLRPRAWRRATPRASLVAGADASAGADEDEDAVEDATADEADPCEEPVAARARDDEDDLDDPALVKLLVERRWLEQTSTQTRHWRLAVMVAVSPLVLPVIAVLAFERTDTWLMFGAAVLGVLLGLLVYFGPRASARRALAGCDAKIAEARLQAMAMRALNRELGLEQTGGGHASRQGGRIAVDEAGLDEVEDDVSDAGASQRVNAQP